MDLRLLLNPMAEPTDPPRIPTNNDQSGMPSEPHQILPYSSASLHSRLFLSPRRLDSETASLSSNSSTKRRRTNRGRIEIPRPATGATAMGRSFSEIQPPSDTSSNDEEQDVVKRGVAQLSLSGMFSLILTCVNLDEYGMLKPGTRVEALKSGTQGTWYIARIVEFATFPAHYIGGGDGEDTSQEMYPMVCVHYEGRFFRIRT
jgi:hypothetical protein